MDDDEDVKFLNADANLTKSDGLETFDAATHKYKTDNSSTILWDCNVCGERISTTRDWLLHHFTDWHRRVIKWVDTFRAKCIDQQDEDATSRFTEAINAVKDSVLYTQELFEINNRLVCCACACEVDDVLEHLGSTKHNELVLSIIDSSALIKIKENCLKIDVANVINEELYRNEILIALAQELPPTADSPLEVVVLKRDEKFYSWFEKYRLTINTVVQLKRLNTMSKEIAASPVLSEGRSVDMIKENETTETSITLPELNTTSADGSQTEITLSDRIAGGQILEKSLDVSSTSSILSNEINSCKVCDVRCFSRETFLKHSSTEDHKKKMKIYEFLNSDNKFIIGEEPATAQTELDSNTECIIGLNETYEMYCASSRSRFWICGLCYCGVESVVGLLLHVHGIKHKKRYIDERYPNRKERITNKNEMTAWMNRVVKDIATLEGKGKLKNAMVVTEIPEVLVTLGIGGVDQTLSQPSEAVVITPISSDLSEIASLDNKSDDLEVVYDGTIKQKPASDLAKDEQGNVATINGKSIKEKEDIGGTKKEASNVQNMEKQLKEIVIDESNLALQCETCWTIIPLSSKNKTEKDAKWKQHINSNDHQKKIEARKKWIFDEEHFVNLCPSDHVIKALEQAVQSSTDVVIVGLNDMVETRKAASVSGKIGDMDVVCLTCAVQLVSPKAMASHLGSKNHMMKYLSKYYPEEVAKIFKGFSTTTYSEISRFLLEKGAGAGVVRVYDPRVSDKAKLKGTSSPRSQSNVSTKANQSSPKLPKKEPIKVATVNKNPVQNQKKIKSVVDGTKSTPIVAPMKKTPAKGSTPVSAKKDEKQSPVKMDTSRSTPKSTEKSPSVGGTTLMDSLVSKMTDKDKSASTNSTNSKEPVRKVEILAPNTQDKKIQLLMGSSSQTIPIRYHAFAQPALDDCKEPLIGVEDIYEFFSQDMTYEPSYLCKACLSHCNEDGLIAHLTNVDHRLKYFEKKHKSIYHSLTAGTSPSQKSVLQALAIKQHAQAIERSEGRSRIAQRLSIQVEPGVYGMKKSVLAAKAQQLPFLAFPPTTTLLPPFISAPPPPPPPTIGNFGFSRPPLNSSDMLPPGVSLQETPPISTTLLDRVTAPYTNTAPLPPGVCAKDHVPTLSMGGGKSPYGQAAWSAQCDRFLAKLSGDVAPKNISSGTKETTKSSVDVNKKGMDDRLSKLDDSLGIKKIETKSRTDESKKDLDKSRDRSPSRNSQRRRGGGRSSRSRSPKVRSRSRSRSRRRHRDDSGSKSVGRKSKSPSSKIKSPMKNKKEKTTKRRSKTPDEMEKKMKLDSTTKSEKKSPTKQTGSQQQSIELPDLLIRLAESMVTKKNPESTSSSPKKNTNEKSDFGTLLSRVLGEKARSSSSTVASTSTMSDTDGLGQLLSMLDKKKGGTSRSTTNTTTTSAMGEMEMLVKLLAEEEEKKRRQEEQKNAIMALLSSKFGSSQAAGTSGSSGGGAGGPMVIDYGHGSRRATTGEGTSTKQQPATMGQSFPVRTSTPNPGGKNNDSNDLVSEAMRNVMKAQGAQGVASTNTTTRPTTSGQNPFFRVDMTRPPPPPQASMGFGNFRPPAGPGFFPQQQQQGMAMVNAAAAMLLSTLMNQSLPPRQ